MEKKEDRPSAILKTEVEMITLESLETKNLEDNYWIRQKLSQGGFGLVYKIMRKSDKRVFAAKCIPMSDINANEKLLKTYVQREISFLMGLKTNYIMKLEDACFISTATSAVHEDHLVIVSELAQGSLDDYLKKNEGLIPEEKIMKIFVQVLLGVNFLHRNKIDHRDLKP